MVESFVCPHCQIHAQMNILFSKRDSKNDEYYAVYLCENCHGFTFKCDNAEVNGTVIVHGETIHQYPSSLEVVDQSVSPDVAKMYLQGVRCVNANSPDGAMTCFRKCLQKICISKGADPSKKLWAQVDEVLQGRVVAISTEIREWGNIGAHPDDVEPTLEQAKKVQEFLNIVFQDEYVIPARIVSSQQERNGNNSN